MMEDNIYILAMKFGYENNEGFYYSQLKTHIEKTLKIDISKVREYTFAAWFLDNFQSQDSEDLLKNNLYERKYYMLKGMDRNKESYKLALDGRFYMKGIAVKNYLDYLGLKESRKHAKVAQESSTKTMKIAYISMAITSFLAIASIITSGYFSVTPAPPPSSEVKLNQPDVYWHSPDQSVRPDNERD